MATAVFPSPVGSTQSVSCSVALAAMTSWYVRDSRVASASRGWSMYSVIQ